MTRVVADLYSKASGTGMGYWQAGFDVVAVDIEEQPNNPFEFHQFDVTKLSPAWLRRNFDLVHASPPCLGYTKLANLHKIDYPRLIPRTREILEESGLPYVIENVEQARSEMIDPVMLCGSSFGLRVRRHRLFESNINIEGLDCDHGWQDELPCYEVYVGKKRIASGFKNTGVMPVFGKSALRGGNSHFNKSVAMGIHWMTEEELNQAIPPAFTNFIGRQLKGML